jgi:phosphodiesterase/alkaline phosphatase D-like protein
VTEPACLDMGNPATLPGPACTTEINNPSRTYLGANQKAWLKSALAASTAKWKFIMNGPVITNLLYLPYDRWEGYGAERKEMLEFIRNPDGDTMSDDHIKNVVVLSTDIHAAIYNPTVANPGPAGGSVPEIIAGAIGMDAIYRELPGGILPFVSSLPSIFPAIQFFDIDRRNYVHFDVSTTQATFTYRDNTGSVLKTITMNAE